MKSKFIVLVTALCSALLLTSCVYSYDSPDRGPQHRPPPSHVKPAPAPRPPAHKPAPPRPAPKPWHDNVHR